MGLSEPLLYSQALNYLKALSRKGVDILILSFEKGDLLDKEKERSIREDLGKAGIKWSFLIYHKRPQFLSKPYDMARGAFRIFYLMLKDGIGIVHARGTFCAILGILPCVLLRRKMLFDMRGLMAEEYADAGLWEKGSFSYRIVSALEFYFIKRSEEIIVLTNKARDFLASRGRVKNVTVIPTCVDLDRFNPIGSPASKNGMTLIYAGSVGTWYMISEMMDFYQELISFNRDSLFFILSQTQKTYIEQYIPEGLNGKVVVDSAGPEDVPSFMSRATMGIFFIKPCFSKTASSPTKFGEYLACGLPVVINKGVGDTEEIVRENRVGVVVDAFTPAEYRGRIVEMNRLLSEGGVLRKRCRAVAERYFSLREGSEAYWDIYRRIKKG